MPSNDRRSIRVLMVKTRTVSYAFAQEMYYSIRLLTGIEKITKRYWRSVNAAMVRSELLFQLSRSIV